MPLVINTNVSSLSAQRYLGVNTFALNKSMEKLASGYRINRAGDDAAGLSISENLRAQIRGSQKALQNVQDGINVLNVVDGAYQTITDNFQRMRELAVQAANDTYDVDARSAIQTEIFALYAENDRIANSTQFNGVDLLSALTPANYNIQVGPNSGPNDVIDIVGAIGDSTMGTGYGLGLAGLQVDTNANAQIAIGNIDNGTLDDLLQRRGTLGAMINRLESVAQNLQISIENLSASESRIRDVDVAAESAELVRNQILQQSASAMLAQANQSPSIALQLLQG